MLSSQLKDLAVKLDARLSDEFAKKLLFGAMRVLGDAENPIRLNLFASAVRELFGHVLHSLAPDDQIQQCRWYTRVEGTEGPTRRQRAIYATQGGLSDQRITELGVEPKDVHRECIRVIDELSKYTHVRPHTLVDDGAEIAAFASEALAAFNEMFDVFAECRDSIIKVIFNRVTDQAFRTLTESTIGELDVLSSHTCVEGPIIEEVWITQIDAERVHYEVEGYVEVTLNYGSGSDFRRGDGVSINDTYPFTINMTASINKLEAFRDVECKVDNDSFYH